MSDIWFSADLHLGHENILRYNDRRFSSIKEHDDYIIDRWNSTVNSKDTGYILGDYAWRDHNKFIARMHGHKILILGSHDKMSQINAAQFTAIYPGMHITTLNGVPFVMTHCAMKTWERSHYGSINLYGHSHGRITEQPYAKQMDVGVDVQDDYTPFSLEFILYKMSLKQEGDKPNDEILRAVVKENKDNNARLLSEWRNHG